MPINFFDEGSDFQLENPEAIISWLEVIAADSELHIGELNYIFCTDDYLLEINKKFLAHDYYTDILTFDTSEDGNIVEGDIFISIDRVEENSRDLNLNCTEELQRVIVHGLLHLIGFNDKTEEQKKAMSEKEDACLSLLKKQSST